MSTWCDEILRTGGLLSPSECSFLEGAAYDTPMSGDALEVGHYTGLSTCVLLEGLPPTMRLHTIDNHAWRRVSPRDFEKTIAHYTRERDIHIYIEDMETALPKIAGPFSFVFYDAGHSAEDCDTFFDLVCDKFADDAMLLFDDADWDGMRQLERRALDDGFIDITRLPLYRHQIGYTTGDNQIDLDLGKRHPNTYTLKIMQRSNEGRT